MPRPSVALIGTTESCSTRSWLTLDRCASQQPNDGSNWASSASTHDVHMVNSRPWNSHRKGLRGSPNVSLWRSSNGASYSQRPWTGSTGRGSNPPRQTPRCELKSARAASASIAERWSVPAFGHGVRCTKDPPHASC